MHTTVGGWGARRIICSSLHKRCSSSCNGSLLYLQLVEEKEARHANQNQLRGFVLFFQYSFLSHQEKRERERENEKVMKKSSRFQETKMMQLFFLLLLGLILLTKVSQVSRKSNFLFPSSGKLGYDVGHPPVCVCVSCKFHQEGEETGNVKCIVCVHLHVFPFFPPYVPYIHYSTCIKHEL